MSHDPKRASLLDGRNVKPLSDREKSRAANTFLGLDRTVNAKYQSAARTRFIVSADSEGEEFGEIIFSDDIFPGTDVTNPNSMLSLAGAAAHELAHYHRWLNKTELPHNEMVHIDEAMTSLDAALRFENNITPADVRGLISDAVQRLQMHVKENQK